MEPQQGLSIPLALLCLLCAALLCFTLSKYYKQKKIRSMHGCNFSWGSGWLAWPHMPISVKKAMLSLRDSMKASTSAGVL